MIVGHRWRYPPKMTHDHGSPGGVFGCRRRKDQVSESCQSAYPGPERSWEPPPRRLSGELTNSISQGDKIAQ